MGHVFVRKNQKFCAMAASAIIVGDIVFKCRT